MSTKKKKMKIFGALIHSDRKSRLPSLMKEELEDAEDADEAEGTDDEQIVRAVQEEAQIDGQRGQQIDDAEEAEDVLPRLLQAVHTCQVFDGEEQREHVLHDPQHQVCRMGEDVHTFQDDEQHAEHDAANEYDVEQFAFGRIRFEYDGVDFLFQFFVVQEVMPTLV